MGGLTRLLTRNEVLVVKQSAKQTCSELCPHVDTRVGSCVCAMCVFHVKTIFRDGKAAKVVCSYNKAMK